MRRTTARYGIPSLPWQPLTLLSIAYLLYSLAMFAYLALPLMRSIATGSVALAREYISGANWHDAQA